MTEMREGYHDTWIKRELSEDREDTRELEETFEELWKGQGEL